MTMHREMKQARWFRRWPWLALSNAMLVAACGAGETTSLGEDGGADANSTDAAVPVCPMRDGSNPPEWGDSRRQADLPDGACDGEIPACDAQSIDPCPSGTRGPSIGWRCECANDAWNCQIVSRGKSACL